MDPRQITIEAKSRDLEAEIDADSPVIFLQDILHRQVAGEGTLDILAREGKLRVKGGEKFTEHSYEKNPLEHMEEVIDKLIQMPNSTIFRGVKFESGKDYKKKIAAIEKTGKDKRPEEMSPQERELVDSYNLDPHEILWAAESYRKAWEYAVESTIPRRLLLAYDPQYLEKVEGDHHYLYRSRGDLKEALEALIFVKYES